jgi:hypothetical protein
MRATHFVLAVVLTTLISSGCGESAPPVSTVHVAFFDVSTSGAPQVERWLDALVARVLSRMNMGDAIVIYPINSRTEDVAPIFETALLPAGVGMTAEAAATTALKAARAEAIAAVRSFVASQSPASASHIFEAIYRIPTPAGHQTHVVYLTDGLAVSDLLNLERQTVSDVAKEAQRIVETLRLPQGKLAGATVEFVLDDPTNAAPRPPNDRTALKALYAAIFEAHLGATLTAFDSSVRAVGLLSVNAGPVD